MGENVLVEATGAHFLGREIELRDRRIFSARRCTPPACRAGRSSAETSTAMHGKPYVLACWSDTSKQFLELQYKACGEGQTFGQYLLHTNMMVPAPRHNSCSIGRPTAVSRHCTFLYVTRPSSFTVCVISNCVMMVVATMVV